MGVVGLDHDRATGGQRRGGVAARHGEGEGKIACSENGDRSQRDFPHSQVHARQGLAIGAGGIDAQVQIAAVSQHAREHPQLACRATQFALKARPRKAAFEHGALDEFLADRFKARRNALQELGADVLVCLAEGVEGLGRQPARRIDHVRRRAAVAWLQWLAGRGRQGGDLTAISTQGLAPYDHHACQHRWSP